MFQFEIAEMLQWLAEMESCLHFRRGEIDRRITEIAWARTKIAELEALEFEFANA